MKLKTTITLLVLFISGALMAQDNIDTIQYSKGFGGYRFEMSGQALTYADMLDLMKDLPDAEEYMEKAKTLSTIVMSFGYVGGGLIGYPLGVAIGGGDPAWGVAAAGAGLIIIAIPLAHAAERNVIKAVEIYNSQVKKDENFTIAQ